MSAQSIKNAVEIVLHELKNGDGPNAIRLHPGNATDILASGVSRLMHHEKMADRQRSDALEEVSCEYESAAKLCESPIERELLAALMTGHWRQSETAIVPVFDPRSKEEDLPRGGIVIIPQLSIGPYRLDFAIAVADGKSMRLVGLECDGAPYHDAMKDMRRDAFCSLCGIATLRFSGSDIRKDAIEIADRIIAAIEKWAGVR